MRLYFGLGSIPELARLEPEQRRRVWRRAHSRVQRDWRWWAGIACAACFVGFGAALGDVWGLGLGGLFGAFFFLQVLIWLTLPFIRRDVRDRHASAVPTRAVDDGA